MTQNPTTRELVDACRVDHDDPQRTELPELAPLAREVGQNAAVAKAYEQSQQFDRQVRAALDDVSLPAGFAERMLAGCEAALVTPTEKAEPKLAAKKANSRRKLVLAGLTSLAGVALMVLGVTQLIWPPKISPVSPDELAQSVLKWEQEVNANAKNWTAPTKGMLASYPVDRALSVVPSRGIALPAGVAAYELKIRSKSGEIKRAILFVQPSNRPHNIRAFPFTRLPASGVVTMSAWQRDGRVYVLFITDESVPDEYIQRAKLT